MDAGTVAVVAAALFAWGALSGRLQRADLTAPIVFVAVGVVLHESTSVNAAVEAETVKLLTELTLVWVLFSDAAGVRVEQLRADTGVFIRLLGLALPLTVVLGWLVAWAMFGGLDVWLALLVAAAVAPTDASLGAAVIANPAVPARIREILNVESGLNDGIVTPVVLVALAGGAAAEGHGNGVGHALLQLLLGAATGLAIGAVGGQILRRARERGWGHEGVGGPASAAGSTRSSPDPLCSRSPCSPTRVRSPPTATASSPRSAQASCSAGSRVGPARRRSGTSRRRPQWRHFLSGCSSALWPSRSSRTHSTGAWCSMRC